MATTSKATANAEPTGPFVLYYEAPTIKPSVLACEIIPSCASLISRAAYSEELHSECPICHELLVNSAKLDDELSVKVKACGHSFHLGCLVQSMMHHGFPLKCPVCKTVIELHEEVLFKALRGNMPSGSMRCRVDRDIIAIEYSIHSDTQKIYHPNPGVQHDSTYRTAYLPNSQEGVGLLRRLQVAFLCGLTFTVDRENCVIWSSVHHKTLFYDGSERHGYPDNEYISNCHHELDALAVPSLQGCTDFLGQQHSDVLFEPQNETDFFLRTGISDRTDGEQIQGSFLKKIESKEFLSFAETGGVICPTLDVNPNFKETVMYKSFMEELESLKTLGRYSIAVVFHGTPEGNISQILKMGLDPKKRCGQAYGAGEYFSPRPAMPVGFCHGGKKILVFLVIIDSSDIRCHDIVVVEESHRQLPLGIITFLNLSSIARKHAYEFKELVQKLLVERAEKEKIAREARAKERIISLLVAGEYMGASDVYNNVCQNGIPPMSWAQEVSLYVHDHIRDIEQVQIHFPNLPDRPIDAATVPSLEVRKCEAESAKIKTKVDMLMKMNASTATSSSPRTWRRKTSFPLDGAWECHFITRKQQRGEGDHSNDNITENSGVVIMNHTLQDMICVLKHQFMMYGTNAGQITEHSVSISFDEDYPMFIIDDTIYYATSTIKPGDSLKVGDTLEWIIETGDHTMVWKRLC